MSDNAKWYVVHTYSGYENKVKQNIEKVVENRKLQDVICEVVVPVEVVTEKVKDKKAETVDSYVENSAGEDEKTDTSKAQKTKEVEKKIFPSYVFVKMVLNDDSWYIVRNTRGVTGFVGPGSKPVPLSDREVEALGVGMKKTAEAETAAEFKEGDIITVSEGNNFVGMDGVVKSVDSEAGKVEVIVSVFGRETPLILPVNQIKAKEE